MPVYPIIGVAKFDHLIKVVAIRYPHYNDALSLIKKLPVGPWFEVT